MKKYTPMELFRLLAAPAAAILMGLILLLSPDTASALVGKLLGWVFLLLAVADGISAFSGGKKVLLRALFVGLIGLWVLANPLRVTKTLGRILGLTFFIWGINSFRRADRQAGSLRTLAAGAVTVLGIVLFLLPMTATRLVLKIAGIVIIGIGAADVFDRLQGRKRLDRGNDSTIIDVEKV